MFIILLGPMLLSETSVVIMYYVLCIMYHYVLLYIMYYNKLLVDVPILELHLSICKFVSSYVYYIDYY